MLYTCTVPAGQVRAVTMTAVAPTAGGCQLAGHAMLHVLHKRLQRPLNTAQADQYDAMAVNGFLLTGRPWVAAS